MKNGQNTGKKVKKMKEQEIQTSSFGSLAKINHNSAKFYNSRLYENLEPQKESPEIQIDLLLQKKI